MKFPQFILAALLILSMGLSLAADAEVRVIALFYDKALLQVGDKQKIVKKGETFEGVLLESASGRGAVVVIDGNRLKLGLNQSIAGNFKKPDRSSMKIYPDSLGMYYVKGAINGQPTRFLVDTGATFVTMSGRKARSLKIDYLRGIRSTAQTAAAIVPVFQIKLESVSIGGIRLPNVDATVIAGDQPVDVLLGNSFLQHTRMQKAGSVLEIRQRF
ncbi:MAG: TIGR02281 family clan AA aspartic protease [Gammaproteobacteria bacterium]|nr:TIGR02281 family clan AA aspartic protease [Gammaproteobacteria bacterium]MDH3857666.1 TIGR02281 family clan AA aspartic protease [Gammaproteobacteria bacterium]